MKEIRQIINAYELACQQGKKVVLATVVHIEGSAYRAPGARMLITEDGMLMGAISGGCLEGDVLRKAMLVMMENTPMLITYDTSDELDAALGISLGCDGIIRILLEPIAVNAGETPISLLKKITATRLPSVVVSFFSTADKKYALQGTRLVITGNEKFMVNTGMPLAYETIAADIQKIRTTKAAAFIEYPASESNSKSIIAFIEYIAPPLSLVVAGAGNDVLPLVALGELLGWDITLMDGRPGHANATRFPGCRVVVAHPENVLQKTTVDAHTAIVLMSHNYHYDKAVLMQAIKSPAPYIGILGPVKKRDRMLKELEDEGIVISTEQRNRIYGPTGLDIGAETAEEIALSIVAEIKAKLTGKSVPSLRDHEGSIHQRATRIVASMQSYGILLLAAGASKRLGVPKQQLIYHGDTLLRHAANEAMSLQTAATIVVIGHASSESRHTLEGMPLDIVENENAQEGMASSIRKGMHHIRTHYPKVKNVLIMLCDQPYVNASHLRTLIEKQQAGGAAIVASYYDGRKGVPALFDESVFPQLQALVGDTGAKYIIESFGDAVATVPFPQGAIDIDTREVYRQVIEPGIGSAENTGS